MMQRDFILDGDVTTVNGSIKAASQGFPIKFGSDGKNACFEGDAVYCPACTSWGVTKCIPPFRPWTNPEGRQINLDGDLCVCKCTSPPRLVSRAKGVQHMAFSKHELVGATEWLAYAGDQSLRPTEASEKFGRIFSFLDSETGRPLANRRFLVNSNESILEAKTDSKGFAVIEAQQGQVVNVHLVFESPMGELNCKVGI